jgi:hypothetical protein
VDAVDGVGEGRGTEAARGSRVNKMLWRVIGVISLCGWVLLGLEAVFVCAWILWTPRCHPFPKVKLARFAVEEARLEVSQFVSKHGRCPGPGQTRATTGPARDPWGTPLEVSCSAEMGGSVVVRSSGPDRVSGTADDIETDR